jgi:hypothetical protein
MTDEPTAGDIGRTIVYLAQQLQAADDTADGIIELAKEISMPRAKEFGLRMQDLLSVIQLELRDFHQAEKERDEEVMRFFDRRFEARLQGRGSAG